MEKKKFNTYLGLVVAISMVLSLIYIIYNNREKNVVNYKLDEGYYYSGPMEKSKFEGRGTLLTPDGIYQGDFEDSRFMGPGVFKEGLYEYQANFDYEKGNDNIIITMIDGTSFIKANGEWIEVER